jgi:hypothetical protein
VNHASDLAGIIADHSNELFGRSLDASAFHVSLLAGGTRQVYRAVPRPPGLAAIVVKARSARHGDDKQAVAVHTDHEFAIHAAAYEAMVAAGRLDHRVPRPLLALPLQGLLFMEQAPGQSVKQWITGEWLRPSRYSDNDKRVRRSGEWLFTFAVCAAPLPLLDTSEAAERTLAAGRVNHYVYSLVGLTGARLVERMLEQVRRRLHVYRVGAVRARRIDRALTTVLSDLPGARDLQGNVHGKYSIADVLISPDRVVVIDLEQTARGSLYLDAAYFLYQLVMITRWQPVGSRRRVGALRAAFLSGRAPGGELDTRTLDAFIAYYLVNSLRPGGGVAGLTARMRALHWLDNWVQRGYGF